MRLTLHISGVAAAMVLLAGAVSAQQVDTLSAPKGNRALLGVLVRFLADPTHSSRFVQPIMDSAAKRNDVMVSISAEVTPWMAKDYERRVKALLLCGFFAGDMIPQLQSGKQADNPLGGVEGALTVYAALLRQEPSLSIPELDAWQEMKGNGTLAAHVDSLVGAGKKP